MDIVYHHEAMAIHFQEELLMEMLSRLPVRSLLRFKCISKFWKTLISEPYFKMKHLNHAKNDKNSQKLLTHQRGINDNIVSMYSWPLSPVQLVEDVQKLDCPISSKPWHCACQCCCNGLVFLTVADDSVDEGSIFLLWNPSTKESIVLPNPEFPRVIGTCLGFGYDSTSGDYKLLQVQTDTEDRNLRSEILTLKSGSWRKMDKHPRGIRNSLTGMQSLAFVHETFHWIGISGNHFVFPRDCCVVSFSISNEAYGEIPLPEQLLCLARNASIGVAVIEGKLCVHSFSPRQSKDTFKLWLMKDYDVKVSWNASYTIGDPGILFAVPKYRFADGEVLFWSVHKECIGHTFRTSKGPFGLWPRSDTIQSGIVFTESLISPKSLTLCLLNYRNNMDHVFAKKEVEAQINLEESTTKVVASQATKKVVEQLKPVDAKLKESSKHLDLLRSEPRVAELKLELFEVNVEYHKLNLAIESGSRAVEDADKGIKAANKRAMEAQSGAMAAERRLTDAKLKDSSKHLDLLRSELRVAELKLELFEVNMEYHKLNLAIESGSRAVEDADKGIKAANKRAMEAQSGAMAAERRLTDAKLKDSSKHLDLLRSEPRVAELKLELFEVNVEYHKLNLEIESASRAVEDADKGIKAANKRAMEAQSGAMAAERRLTDAKLKDSSKHLDLLRSELRVAELKLELFEVNVEYHKLNLAIESGSRAVEDADKGIKAANKCAMEAQSGAMAAERRLTDAKLKDSSKHLDLLRSELRVAELKLELFEVNVEYHKLNLAIESGSRAVEDADKGIKAANKHAMEAQSGAMAAERRLTDAKLKDSSKHLDLLRSEPRVAELKLELFEVNVEYHKLNLEIESASRAVEDADKGIKAANKRAMEAQSGAMAAQRRLTDATELYEAAKAGLAALNCG